MTAVASSEATTPQQRLERLYTSSRDDVYAYVASVLGDRALAEDVTAAAFERAFRRRALFNPRRGSERAWLFGIARNAALDELRRRRRVTSLLDEPDAAAHDAAAILDAALAVLVIAAAALLPLGALALTAWTVVSLTRRRLREQALDAS